MQLPGLATAAPAYAMTEGEWAARLAEHNPVNQIDVLVKAKMPLDIIAGDVDEFLPLDRIAGPLIERYKQAGDEAPGAVPS